jgi:FKBP-type peptidyl-prolyl cis-trans isomerase 2
MSGKKALIMAVLLVATVALMAGCAGQSNTAKTGDNVTVDYVLTVGDNTSVVDTSNATIARNAGIYNEAREPYEPITFVIGSGNYLPDLENATIGMKVGETKNVTITAANGYGEYDPTALQPINMSEFIDLNITPVVNDSLSGVYYWPVRIDSINVNASDYNNSTVLVDFNHPMAGKELHFQITLRKIEAASPTK